jgi:hypothetical protein
MKSRLVVAAWLLGICVSAFADGPTLINQKVADEGLPECPNQSSGFAIVICHLGSYLLSSNVSIPQGSQGILITANHVQLDLGGFSLTSGNNCSGFGTNLTCKDITTIGISVQSTLDVTLLNGSISGFGFGVSIVPDRHLQKLPVGELIEKIHVSHNAQTGINVESAVVRDCTASENGTGIEAADSILVDNVANGNKVVGIQIDNTSTVSGNVSNYNGEFGFNITCPSVLSNNAALENGNLLGNGHPIHEIGQDCALSNNTFQ